MLRRLPGRSALLLAAIGLISPLVPVAHSAPATAEDCVAAGNVWVHVEAGDTVKGGCATEFSTGREALTSAGFDIVAPGGFLTHIDGVPAAPGPQDWWTYWQLNPTDAGRYTDWSFSSLGMDSAAPLAGSVEGWALHDSYSVTAPPPKTNPLEGYTAPPKEIPTAVVDLADDKLRACVNKTLAQPASAVIGAEQASGVTSLNCFYGGITDLTGLEHFTGLKTLDLTLNKVADAAPLAGLTSLETLVLDGNPIADPTPLAGLTTLTTLDLDGAHLSDLRPLGGLTSLQTLSLNKQRGSTPLTSLAGLEPLKGLTSLNVSQNQVTSLTPITGLTGLTSLVAFNNQVADLSPLAGLASLTELNLHTNGLVDISGLAPLTSLTKLNLVRNQLTDVSPLTALTSLTDLSLSRNPIADPTPLAKLTKLTDLQLDNTGLTDVSFLADLPALNWVILHDNHLTDISALKGRVLRGYGALTQTVTTTAVVGEPAPRPRAVDLTGEEIAITLPEGVVADGDTVIWPEVGTHTVRFSSPSKKFVGTITVEVTTAPVVEPTPEPSADPTPEPSGEPTSEPSAEPTSEPSEQPWEGDLYTTPGFHDVGGRRWSTTCEPYSQTVRCTTLIWATTVKDGKRVDGWAFNSLTYRPSPRALWEGNPLATPGEQVIDGRRWRTECDTALTGPNACRASIWTDTLAIADGEVVRFRGWQLNNIVIFS